MLKKEFYRERQDGVRLFKTYSDQDKLILQNETGNEYESAVDVEDSTFTYTETDKSIPKIEENKG